MKNKLKNLALALVNILFLGIANALTRQLSKGIFLQLVAAGSFALGGYCGLFSAFSGMVLVYAVITTVYLYAFFSFLNKKTYDFKNWRKNIVIYLASVLVIKLILIVPVRSYFFEPYRYNDSYIMTDKRTSPTPIPLYIFWNKDFSKIGKSINE